MNHDQEESSSPSSSSSSPSSAFAGYSFAKPKKTVKIKINGTIYILPKQFTLNLKGGQYATLTVALLLAPGQSVGVTSPTDPPPTGFGSLTEEAVIRAIITNDVTDQPENALVTPVGPQGAGVEDPVRHQDSDRHQGQRDLLHRRRGPVDRLM